MSEHGILFTGAMVRSLLRGEKTVTRRPSQAWLRVRAGDTLWVRETWRLSGHGGGGEVFFAASVSDYERREKGPWRSPLHLPRALSRITLRVTADAYEQRIGDMTDADARAEGCDFDLCASGDFDWPAAREMIEEKVTSAAKRSAAFDRLDDAETALDAFRVAWEALHGAWDPEQRVVVLPFDEQLARLAREEAEVLAGTTPESAPVRRATPAVVPPETPVDELAAAKAARALRRGGFALPGKSA